jgi:hypothetical protein
MIKYHIRVLERKFFGFILIRREFVVHAKSMKEARTSFLTENPQFELELIWG